MSIYDDYIADAQYDRDFPFGYPDTIDPVWVTADGTEIPVSEMDDDHIRNCMRLVGEDDAWYDVFQEELDHRMEQWFD